MTAGSAEPTANQCYVHLLGLMRSEQSGIIVLSLILIAEYSLHLFFLILENLFYIATLGDQ